MKDGVIYTLKTFPKYDGKQITMGDIMEEGEIDKSFFILEAKLYYTSPDIHHSDETRMQLEPEQRKTWQYIKGGKKIVSYELCQDFEDFDIHKMCDCNIKVPHKM